MFGVKKPWVNNWKDTWKQRVMPAWKTLHEVKDAVAYKLKTHEVLGLYVMPFADH